MGSAASTSSDAFPISQSNTQLSRKKSTTLELRHKKRELFPSSISIRPLPSVSQLLHKRLPRRIALCSSSHWCETSSFVPFNGPYPYFCTVRVGPVGCSGRVPSLYGRTRTKAKGPLVVGSRNRILALSNVKVRDRTLSGTAQFRGISNVRKTAIGLYCN